MGENVRPKEVTYASYLVLAEVIAGLIVAGINLYMWGDWTDGLGLIMAIVGIWIYFQILKQDPQAWTIAVVFSIAAIVLYALGENWPGAILSLIAVIYLNMPDVKTHFQQ